MNARRLTLWAALLAACTAHAEVMRVRVAQDVRARTPSGIYINLPAGTEIGACATTTHAVIGYNTAARVVIVEQPCELPLPALLRDGFESPTTKE